MVFGWKAIGVYEVGDAAAELADAAIHGASEGFDAAGVVASEGEGDVVCAADEERVEELAACVALAGADAKLGWSSLCVLGLNDDVAIQISAFGNQESCEELLGACDGQRVVFVFAVEDAARSGIEEERRATFEDGSALLVVEDHRRLRFGFVPCGVSFDFFSGGRLLGWLFLSLGSIGREAEANEQEGNKREQESVHGFLVASFFSTSGSGFAPWRRASW